MRHGTRVWALTALGALLAGSALSQGIYRHVGPDGRVTFTDQPPATASASPVPGASAPASPGSELPPALRVVVQRYPVTLYTSSNCAPCDQGRDLLKGRGVPFTEKTVTTPEDSKAFQSLSGGTNLPHLTLGAQALTGFSSAEWIQYLDAAGYPKQSALPRGYPAAAPSPLAPVAAAPAAAPRPARAAEAPPAPSVAPAGPTRDNPAGIRF